MKKQYNGIDAVVISFDDSESVINTSGPSTCIHIYANTGATQTGVCTNDPSTTARVWFGWGPDD